MQLFVTRTNQMKQSLYAAFLCLFLSQVVTAQWNEGEDRTPVPDNNWRASSGEFGALLLITNRPDEFFEQWNKPPSPDYQPSMSTTDTAHRGDTVVAITLFSGCEVDDDGNCDSEIDFRVLNPDGSVYSEHRNAELWKDKPGPPRGTLQVSVDNLAFKVETDDPLGNYKIEVAVRDNNSGKILNLSRDLYVNEEQEGDECQCMQPENPTATRSVRR